MSEAAGTVWLCTGEAVQCSEIYVNSDQDETSVSLSCSTPEELALIINSRGPLVFRTDSFQFVMANWSVTRFSVRPDRYSVSINHATALWSAREAILALRGSVAVFPPSRGVV